VQRQRDERLATDAAPSIRRRQRTRRREPARGSSPWWRVLAGVLASSAAVALGVAVWPQSAAVAFGWLLIAVVALSMPVARARRVFRARRTPDAATAGQVLDILTQLDEVEHRVVDLGPAWPRLSVGPTGVLVIDVCPAGHAAGSERRGDAKVLQGRLARTARAGHAARRALDDAGVDIPVRTLAVTVGDGRTSASSGVRLIDPAELSGALSAGPVLPMNVVDAAFTSLTRADRLVTD
jgi:hypothetical protein